MKKTYILDTNVLLSDSNALNAFEENDLIIPLIVLEELDRHKSRQDEVGAAARKINRILDDFRKQGSLSTGVKTVGGGTLIIQSIDSSIVNYLPQELQTEKVDNMIIAFAKKCQLQVECNRDFDQKYILVSKDINVRIKCDAIGVPCEDYRKLRIISTQDMYTGVCVQEATQEFISSFYDKERTEDIIAPSEWQLCPNQIIVIKQYGVQSGSTIARAIKKHNNFVLKLVTQHENCFGLKPRNKEQNFSLDLLYDPEIKLVTLTGIAGTGKSLLALAAGLDQNEHMGSIKRYKKLVIARTTVPVGKDVGFLPGSLNEKLAPWQGATIDNLNFLMNRTSSKDQRAKQNKKSFDATVDPYLSLMIENGVVEIASIAHIRGRSIPDSLVIIEESQNCSPHEIRTILTRIGEGSKIILCGDTDQIDNNYLDKTSNGLTYVIEKFKQSALSAHVCLLKGERSQLATEAAKLL